MVPSSAGAWLTLAPQVWETAVTPCDCCNQVVAKRPPVVNVEGGQRRLRRHDRGEYYRVYIVGRRR